MIKLVNAEKKKYVVLGFGKSGEATANSLRACRADFIVWDDGELAREKILASGFTLCDPLMVDLTGYEAVVLSPSIPLTHPTPHPVVAKAKAAGVPVIGELDLLYQTCPDATYIGVTGTNGKSTTTALIAHILKQSGRKVEVGGNLGTPALALQPLGSDGFYVLEMSSFQLDLMQKNPFKAAVLLNITPDHFDRHGGMEGYIKAKSRILRRDTPQTLVIGSDEKETASVLALAKTISSINIEEISVDHNVERGVVATRDRLFIFDTKGAIPIVDLKTMRRLPGAHNAQNAAAAFAVCRSLGLGNTEIVDGLLSFPGLAHRQQQVGTLGRVLFVNDSKATNADAASKALVCYENIYWIAGGKPKAGGLNGLEALMPNVRHTFLIGVASDDFGKWLDGKAPYTKCGTLDVAVEAAYKKAIEEGQSEPVVLLSPACASFDQFSGFEERGDRFAAYVHALQEKGPAI